MKTFVLFIGELDALAKSVGKVFCHCSVGHRFTCVLISEDNPLDSNDFRENYLNNGEMYLHFGVVCVLGCPRAFVSCCNAIKILKASYPTVPVVTTFIVTNSVMLLTGLECVVAVLQFQNALITSDMCLLHSVSDAVNLAKELSKTGVNPSVGSIISSSDEYMAILSADIIVTYLNTGGEYHSLWPLQHCSAHCKLFDVYSSLPATWIKTTMKSNAKNKDIGVSRVNGSGSNAKSSKSSSYSYLPSSGASVATREQGERAAATKKLYHEMASALHCRYITSTVIGMNKTGIGGVDQNCVVPFLICNNVSVVDINCRSGARAPSIQYKQLGNSLMASTFVWATPSISYPVLYNSTVGATNSISSMKAGACSAVQAEDVAHMHQYYNSLCGHQDISATSATTAVDTTAVSIVACCMESVLTKQALLDIVNRARAVVRAGAYMDQ